MKIKKPPEINDFWAVLFNGQYSVRPWFHGDFSIQEVFKWLSDKNLNGWNEHAPDWNFSKYIINDNGILTHYFGPSISPLDEEFLKALE